MRHTHHRHHRRKKRSEITLSIITLILGVFLIGFLWWNDKQSDIKQQEMRVISDKIYTEEHSALTLTIKADGTGDFTNIRECFEEIETRSNPSFIVNIYEGTYYINDYYSDEEWSNPEFKGLFLPDNTSLIGVGDKDNIIIYADDKKKRELVSTLNLSNTASLENITFKATNLRYVIHDDFATNNIKGGYERYVKNCVIEGTDLYFNDTYGSGQKSGAKWQFEKTVFINNNDGLAFSNHNNLNFNDPCTITFKECIFRTNGKFAVRLGSLTNDGTYTNNGKKTNVYFEACKINGLRVFEENASKYGKGIVFNVLGKGNEPCIYSIENTDNKQYSIDFSDEVAEFLNSSGENIKRGTPVKLTESNTIEKTNSISDFYGIALTDIPANSKGKVKFSGYYNLSEAGLVTSKGDKVVIKDYTLIVDNNASEYIGTCPSDSYLLLVSDENN